MATEFLKVNCNDCGAECTIFSRATTSISCQVCNSTLTSPSGGKANLVGCTVTENLA